MFTFSHYLNKDYKWKVIYLCRNSACIKLISLPAVGKPSSSMLRGLSHVQTHILTM